MGAMKPKIAFNPSSPRRYLSRETRDEKVNARYTRLMLPCDKFNVTRRTEWATISHFN